MTDQILALDRVADGVAGVEAGDFSFSERVQFLKKFGGHSQSLSTLQPGMEYFDVPGVGYIGYMRKWGMTFVLSNPVAAPEHFELILEHFHARYPNASYIQVSKSVVDILHRRYGLFGTQFGSESRIDLKNWSLKGKKKQIIRTAINQAERNGVTIKERFSDDHTREISEAWIRTRKVKSNEIRFLIRPMEMSYRENERHFYAYEDGKAVGFIYFDPIYENNEIVSYVPNISRANADFRQGIFYALMAHAMSDFQAEGVAYLDLGLIPLSLDQQREPQESRVLKKTLLTLYAKGNFLYNFKGLEFTKSRFRGDAFKTYCCHSRAVPALEFAAMLKLTRVI
jgi:phosphatidylglycerol lysyltransferase